MDKELLVKAPGLPSKNSGLTSQSNQSSSTVNMPKSRKKKRKPNGKKKSPCNLESYKKTAANQSQIQQRMLALNPNRIRPFVRSCVFNLKGKCLRDCSFAHIARPRRPERCKFFMMQSCTAGTACLFSHNVPCKYYQVYNSCMDKACTFSHDAMDYDQRMQFLDDFKCELPPPEIQHDFRKPWDKASPHPLLRREGETSGQNPFTKQVRSLPAGPPQLVQEKTTCQELPPIVPSSKLEDQTVNQTDTDILEQQPLCSIRGFYSDTLNEEDEATTTNSENSPEMPQLQEETIESVSENVANEHMMQEFQVSDNSPWTFFKGVDQRPIRWELRTNDVKSPKYDDLRSKFMLSLSVIDPRLCPVNRKLPPNQLFQEQDFNNRETLHSKSFTISALLDSEDGRASALHNPRTKKQSTAQVLNTRLPQQQDPLGGSLAYSPQSPSGPDISDLPDSVDEF